MKKKKKYEIDITSVLMSSDKPTMALSGAALGFLGTGMLYMILGGLTEAPKGHIWNGYALLGGLSCIGVSMLITMFIFIYWSLVVRKKGIVAPSLIGLGWVFAILGFCSAGMMGVQLAVLMTR